MTGLVERMLTRYRDEDYVIKLKARFLLRICLSGVIVTPAVIGYTVYLHLQNPVYNYSIYWEGLAPLIVLNVLFISCLGVIYRGHYAIAAHSLFVVFQVIIWTIMVLDRSTPVGRLDTMAVLIALLSLSPLIITRNILLIPAYFALTIAGVVLFTLIEAPGMGLSRVDMADFISDTTAAAVIAAIISYNLFSINRMALTHSEESRTKLARVNEELNVTNEELEATNEELESAMEELTATNEEFEAQNRELVTSQEIISESLEEKTVLIKEVHHRVKNNMQIVSSLLNLQALSIDDPRVSQPLKDAAGRIHSMALIHEKIYRADNFSRINMAAYITDLTREIIELYSRQPDIIQVTSRLEPIHLSVDQAVPCGILINEILTNSIKHGCRDEANSRIEMDMSSADGIVTMIIADSGPGMDKGLLDNGSRKTLGLQIIDALAQQLNATLECDIDRGTRFTIRFTEHAV